LTRLNSNNVEILREFKFSNQLLLLTELLVRGAILFVAVLAWARFNNGQNASAIRVATVVFLIYEVVPCIVLHIQYTIRSSDISLSINQTDRFVRFTDPKSTVTVGYDQIALVTINLGSDLYKGAALGWATWGQYHYVVLTLTDGSKKLVTSLLARDARHLFSSLGLPLARRRLFFPIILIPSERSRSGW
jgi:hypothetical protein